MNGEIISQLIYKLIEKQENIDSGSNLLSLYIDTYDLSRKQVISHINSMLTTEFKENPDLINKLHVKRELFDQIKQQISEIHAFSKGLVIFAIFNDKKFDLELLHTNNAPRDEISIRKVFNLGQLLEISSQLHKAVIIQANMNTANIFYMNEDNIELIREVESEYSTSEDQEYMPSFAPTQTSVSVSYGMVNKNKEKREDMKRYWQDIFVALKDEIQGKIHYDYIIVFHTTNFSFIKNSIHKEISHLCRDCIVSEYTNGNNYGDIMKKATDLITSYNKKKKKSIYTNLSHEIELISKDLKQIIDASRYANIDMLFINPESIIPGYIGENNMVFLEKGNGLRRVGNIVPRIIHRVIETAGKVVIYKKPILAKLRFSPIKR